MALQQVGVVAIFDVSQFNRGQRDYTRGLRDAGRATQQFNTQINNINVSQFNSNISSTGSSLSSLGAIAGGAALAGVAALTAGLVALGAGLAESVSTAASFESAFQGVAKTTDGLSTVGADGFIELTEAGEQFKQGLKDLSTEIPATFEELAGIAELGGQLGVTFGQSGDEAQKTLLGFSETITMIADSTNLMAEDAATSLAKMTNLYKDSVDDIAGNIEQLGSTIVALGNSSATTEKDIVNFANRLVGAGASVGLTQDEVLGMSAAFSSLGITAEAGGTAISDAMLKMFSAVNGGEPVMVDNAKAIEANGEAMDELRQKMSSANADLVRFEAQTGITGDEMWAAREAFLAGGGAVENWGRQLGDSNREQVFNAIKKLKDLEKEMANLQGETDNLIKSNGQLVQDDNIAKWAKASGLSVDEFRDLFEKDASAAILKFIEGLQQINAEGGDINAVLSDLGLKTSQQRQAFLKAANAGDIFEESLNTASTAWEENTALSEEAAARYATFLSKLEILKNVFRNVGESIGNEFLPSLTRALQVAIDFVDGVGADMPAVLEAMGEKFEGLKDAFAEFAKGGLGGLVFDLTGSIEGVNIANQLENLIRQQDFSGAANLLTTSFANAVSGLNVGFLGGIGTGLIGELLGIETTIGDVFANIQETITAFVTEGPAGVGSQVGILASLGLSDESIRTVMAGVEDMKTLIATIPDAFSAFQDGGFQGLAEFFGLPNFIPMITELGNIMSGFFAPTVENLKVGFMGFLEAFEPLIPQMGELFNAVKEATPVLAAFAGSGLMLAVGAAKLLGETIAFALPFIGENLAAAIGYSLSQLTLMWETLGLIGEAFQAFMANDVEGLSEALVQMGANIYNLVVGNLLDLGLAITSNMVNALSDLLDAMWPFLEQMDLFAYEVMLAIATGIANNVGLPVDKMLKAITTVFTSARDLARDLFSKLGEAIMEFVAVSIWDNMGMVQSALGDVMQAAIEAALGYVGLGGSSDDSRSRSTGTQSNSSFFDSFTRSKFATPQGIGGDTNVTNVYNLNVNNSLPGATIRQDFELMRALA